MISFYAGKRAHYFSVKEGERVPIQTKISIVLSVFQA